MLILLTLSGFILPVQPQGWRLEAKAQLTIPDNISEILMAHLGQLDEETHRALLKASVIGSRFSVDLLRRVLEINEGRAVAIADKAIQYRLLQGGDATSMEGLSFVNRKLQELTYQIVGDELKREVHRKVAGARESGAVLLDEAMAQIAHHYAHAGDKRRAGEAQGRLTEQTARVWRSDEADDYFQVAARVAAPKAYALLPEATMPLHDNDKLSLPALLKGLIAIRRGVQMYPSGSTYIVRALKSGLAAVRATLSQSESLTLKETSGSLTVNGEALPAGMGKAAAQWIGDMRASRAHSVTFTRATTADELQTMVLAMTRFADTPAATDWSAHLTERQVRGLGVVQKTYRATAETDEALADDTLEGLAAEAERHLPLLKQLLRYTAAAAEAIQLYPKGSDTVRIAIDGLVSSLSRVQERVHTINLGVTPDGFLVNDLRIDGRTFGAGIEVMRELFDRNDISSVSFTRGVSSSDIEAFFRYLARGVGVRDGSATWKERLAELGARRIGVDEYLFVAADAQGGQPSEGSGEIEMVRIDKGTFLKRVLEGSPGDLLDPQIRRALPSFVTELVLDGEVDSTTEVVGRVFGNMDAPEPHLRSMALDVLAEMLSGTSQMVGGALLDASGPHIAQALGAERAQAPLERLIGLSERVVGRQLRSGDLRSAARLLWPLGKGMDGDPDVDPENKRRSEAVVSRLMQRPEFEQTLTALWTPNEERRTLALHLLESCGTGARDRLLQLVLDSPDARGREVYAAQLRAVTDSRWLSERLSALVTPFEKPKRIRHLIEVADRLMDDLYPIIVRGFQHPDATVAAAVVGLLNRLGPEDQRQTLLSMLALPEATMQLRAVALVGEFEPHDVAPVLIELLSKATTLDLRREICTSLGKLGDVRGVPALSRLVHTTRWTRLLRRDAEPEVRVAATWALGSIDSENARSALRSLLDDRDIRVRQGATTVLAASERLPR